MIIVPEHMYKRHGKRRGSKNTWRHFWKVTCLINTSSFLFIPVPSTLFALSLSGATWLAHLQSSGSPDELKKKVIHSFIIPSFRSFVKDFVITFWTCIPCSDLFLSENVFLQNISDFLKCRTIDASFCLKTKSPI